MASNVYEGMFILDPNRYGRDPEAASGQITQIIEQAGGEILVSRFWEERRLAYPIKGHRKGAYWLTYFRLEGGRLDGIQRQCQLNESIIRQMFIKQDPRIVDALVAHALEGGPGSGSKGEDDGDAGSDKQAETPGTPEEDVTVPDDEE